VINQTVGGQEITPNLNQLAKDGLYFDNYYTQVGPGNTADAEFSTMDSLYPLPDDVVFIDYAKNAYKALPQLLVENGYKTYSLHGDVPTFWNRSNIYPRLGYQKAYDLNDFVVTRPVGKGPSDLGDEDLFSQSLPRLESFKQPFMTTLITMSLHTPFILPADLQTLNIPVQTNLTQTQWEYLQAAHYTDKAIGEFIDGLKKDGLYDNSLILIWGDHGSFTDITSALGKNNILPKLNNSQVPMIILAPGTNLEGTENEPASHLDIYPTVVNLFGITPPKSILGQDLLNTKNPVETHFELVSGGVDAILTNNMAYQAGEDGVFTHGSCESLPDQKSLPISDCQNIYTEQSNTVKASNIIIKGNLLSVIAK
jgi:phosphoglycerol transferase MdoB-like AlkP superfamily enzyme